MYIPVEVDRVIEMEGIEFRGLKARCYVHVSAPAKDHGTNKKYALIALFPQHGTMDLGDIDPKTREFSVYEENNPAFYERSANRVIKTVKVPIEQLPRFKTIEDILSIEGLKVASEGKPIGF